MKCSISTFGLFRSGHHALRKEEKNADSTARAHECLARSAPGRQERQHKQCLSRKTRTAVWGCRSARRPWVKIQHHSVEKLWEAWEGLNALVHPLSPPELEQVWVMALEERKERNAGLLWVAAAQMMHRATIHSVHTTVLQRKYGLRVAGQAHQRVGSYQGSGRWALTKRRCTSSFPCTPKTAPAQRVT